MSHGYGERSSRTEVMFTTLPITLPSGCLRSTLKFLPLCNFRSDLPGNQGFVRM
jgi:hypothetical protein